MTVNVMLLIPKYSEKRLYLYVQRGFMPYILNS